MHSEKDTRKANAETMRLAHNVVQIRQSAKKVASSELVLLALFVVPLETRIDLAKLRSTFGTNIDVPGGVPGNLEYQR
jgi:hypothetical protein